MADERLRIVIEALNRASGELKEVQKDLGGVGDSANTAGKSLGDTGSEVQVFNAKLTPLIGTIGALAAATKVAFDFSEEGAAIRQTGESFDRLGLSMDEMRAASRGTIDDMTLMSSTLTLTAGANETLQRRLVESAPQLLEIAKAANAVNPTLGDTAYMYESIATGVKRASPLILDNLGIVVKVGEANEAFAASVGKTVEELTAEEKQLALLNATLEAGDRLIEQAGGSTESFGDAWARVRVELQNTTSDLKEHAAVLAGPIITRYADFLKYSRDSEQSLIGVGASLRALTMMLWNNERATNAANFVWLNMTGQYSEAVDVILDANQAIEEQTGKQRESGNVAKDAAGKLAILNDERERELLLLQGMLNPTRELRSAVGDLGETVGDRSDAFIQYAEAAASAAKATEDWAVSQRNVNTAAAATEPQLERIGAIIGGKLDEENENYIEQMEELNKQLDEQRAELEDLEGQHGAVVTAQNKNTLSANELGLAQTRYNAALERMQEADAGSEAYFRAAVQADKLAEKIGGAGSAQTSYIDNSARMEEVRGEMDETQEKIADLTAAHREATEAIVLGFLQQAAAADGVVTTDEVAAIKGYALATGQWGTATAEAFDLAYGVIEGINEGLITANEGVLELKEGSNRLNADPMREMADQLQTAGERALELDRTLRDLPSSHTFTVNYRSTGDPGSPGGRGVGFVGEYTPQAAGGVSTGGATLVGELGPELVNMPMGAHTMSNAVSNTYNTYNTFHNNIATRATTGTYMQDIALARARM